MCGGRPSRRSSSSPTTSTRRSVWATVYVLTERPASVAVVLDVDLGRPRPYELRSSQFARLKAIALRLHTEPMGMGDRPAGPGCMLIGLALIVLVMWQVAAEVTAPTPGSSLATRCRAALLRQPGILLSNAAVTAAEMVLGFLIGATLGAGLGIIVGSWARRCYPGWWRARPSRSRRSPQCWLSGSGSRFSPAGGRCPDHLLPVAVATADGFASVDQDLVRLMRSFGAEETVITREVRIPAALPFVFTGAKVAAALAVLGAIRRVGGRQAGLGYLLLLEQRALDTDEVFAIIAVLSLLGIGFVALVSWLERLIIPGTVTALHMTVDRAVRNRCRQ